MDGQNVFKRAMVGVLGGLVASFAMNQFQRVWSAAKKKFSTESRSSKAARKLAQGRRDEGRGPHL